MEVKIADTFTKSLKKMIRQQTWWYKTYDFFRRDIGRFFRNVWRFRKPLYHHYWWDHHSMLMFMETALTHMSDRMEKDGMEIDISRLKKVDKMRRVIEIIKNYNESMFIEMAEKELGELHIRPFEFEPANEEETLFRLKDDLTEEQNKHNRKVYDRARQIEEQEWKEFCKILQGQDHKDYKKYEKTLTEEEKKQTDQYYKWFDGSGLKGWWD